MKKIAAMVLTCFLLMSQAFAIDLYVNGSQIVGDAAPVVQNGRTLVPVRTIFEALGAEITWDELTKTVIATKGDTMVCIVVNDKTASVNGTAKTMEVPATIIEGRTMVPVRFVSEALQADVAWDQYRKIIYIATDGYTNPTITAPVVETPAVTTPSSTSNTSNSSHSSSTASSSQYDSGETSYQTTGHTIYVTKTGKKYHYDPHCNGGTYYESTLAAAQKRGLKPCSKCVY